MWCSCLCLFTTSSSCKKSCNVLFNTGIWIFTGSCVSTHTKPTNSGARRQNTNRRSVGARKSALDRYVWTTNDTFKVTRWCLTNICQISGRLNIWTCQRLAVCERKPAKPRGRNCSTTIPVLRIGGFEGSCSVWPPVTDQARRVNSKTTESLVITRQQAV